MEAIEVVLDYFNRWLIRIKLERQSDSLELGWRSFCDVKGVVSDGRRPLLWVVRGY